MDIYSERIKPLFAQSGKSDAELEREIGIPAKKISQWNINYTKSYTKYIPQIAAYFHVSTDYLLGNTDDPTPPVEAERAKKALTEISERELDMSLIKRLVQLTPDEMEKVDAFVQGLLASRQG